MSGKAYGRVVKKNTVGTEAGSLVEWAMDDAKGTKVWTEAKGKLHDRMQFALDHKDDPHNPDKVDVKYDTKKITLRSGETIEVNWATSVG